MVQVDDLHAYGLFGVGADARWQRRTRPLLVGVEALLGADDGDAGRVVGAVVLVVLLFRVHRRQLGREAHRLLFVVIIIVIACSETTSKTCSQVSSLFWKVNK